jgi:hypothetical protein
MAEYKSRSNDPRITMGGKKDKYKYDMALEVARQPANTPEGKRMKKDAQNYVRAFESRFQNEAFVRSGRDPYTAGGKGAAKDETKVNKVAAKTSGVQATKKSVSKIKTTARVAARTRAAKKAAVGSDTKPFNVKLMTPRELVGGTEPRSTKKPEIKVTKKLSQAPKRTPKNAQTLRRFAKGGKK